MNSVKGTLMPPTHTIVIAVVLMCLPSCGKRGGLDKVIVKGSVTYKGEPVENGQIRFYPLGETPGAISGASIKDGKYVAKAKNGVPVGMHEVRIEGFRAQTSEDDDLLSASEKPARGKPKDPRGQYIPAKYNKQSELVADVNAENKTLDFDLD